MDVCMRVRVRVRVRVRIYASTYVYMYVSGPAGDPLIFFTFLLS